MPHVKMQLITIGKTVIAFFVYNRIIAHSDFLTQQSTTHPQEHLNASPASETLSCTAPGLGGTQQKQ
ncbi:conserved protein of unknown function [Pseudomonas marincola]|uniref:Uncharacterized protein n=1 Tax=Pseudomonas marincola TaxID=437900 RepID=A0A653E7B4_9PSED|nr:conserved protein of unknown function [Pseudomonas marincola]